MPTTSPAPIDKSIPRKTLTSPAPLLRFKVTAERSTIGPISAGEVMNGPSKVQTITAKSHKTVVGTGGYGRLRLWINGLTRSTIALAAFVGLILGASAAQADTIRILGLGDSLMAGYGLAEEDAFPTRLEAALRARGHDVELINAGVSGDTTAGGRSRVAWSLADNPDAVLVELGGNDGLRGLPPQETKANLHAILTELARHKIPTLFTGMLAPPNLGREYGDEFQAIFPALAETHDVVFDPFFLEGVIAVEALNQNDGIHPNRKGVDVIVDRILPKVEELIARVKAKRGS
jgi:acyl-CoA thioesterase-1